MLVKKNPTLPGSRFNTFAAAVQHDTSPAWLEVGLVLEGTRFQPLNLSMNVSSLSLLSKRSLYVRYVVVRDAHGLLSLQLGEPAVLPFPFDFGGVLPSFLLPSFLLSQMKTRLQNFAFKIQLLLFLLHFGGGFVFDGSKPMAGSAAHTLAAAKQIFEAHISAEDRVFSARPIVAGLYKLPPS